ncbi:MAG: 50S ribosomal protein L11 methyltransferase [Deltaproteobacteria bacterium]|nr:50S ribosomal protein L11 methyltransferase [Deltaproteobacteria bacterium]
MNAVDHLNKVEVTGDVPQEDLNSTPPALGPSGQNRHGLTNPYDQLYIYYIEGVAEGAEQHFTQNFLGCWIEESSSFLFFSSETGPEIESFLAERGQLRLMDKYQMTYRDWQCADGAEDFQVGRLHFFPYWENPAMSEEELVIPMDPGLVFGNGRHPTTRRCLEVLDRIYSQEKPAHVLDLGTGTGVLALAAARLGASAVTAVDLNQLAVDTALRNVQLNDLTATIAVHQGRAEHYLHLDADLVLANIHFAVLQDLIVQESFLNKKWYVLSGILRSQAPVILDLLYQGRVSRAEVIEDDLTWFTIWGQGRR